MVKIKQCCCGCSLQTALLMLLWLAQFGSSVWTISKLRRVITLSNTENFFEKLGNNVPYIICFLFFYLNFGLIHPILGFITSTLGIIGVQKKDADYLMPYLYYMVYTILLCILYIIFVTISPSAYSKIGILPTSFIDSKSDWIIIVTVIIFMIFIALIAYFLLVVESYRDSTMRTSLSEHVPHQFESYRDSIMRTSLSEHVPHQFHPSAPPLEL